MKNLSKYMVMNQLKISIFSMLGSVLLLSPDAFSQVGRSDGTNDALSQGSTVKRDPFWPVDYMPERILKADKKPTQVKVSTGKKDWNGAMKKVAINGVSSRNNEYLAIVNGELKSVGDTFSVEHGGTTYTWAVASIQPPGSVRLRRVSAL